MLLLLPAEERLKRILRPRHRLELGRELRRGPCLDQQVVGTAEAFPLLCRHVRADELVEVRWTAHCSSPSRRSARRLRPDRVRVLTVPSGMFRKSATSLWDRLP